MERTIRQRDVVLAMYDAYLAGVDSAVETPLTYKDDNGDSRLIPQEDERDDRMDKAFRRITASRARNYVAHIVSGALREEARAQILETLQDERSPG